MTQLTVREVIESELQQVLLLIDHYDRPGAPHPSKEKQVTILKAIQNTGGCVVGGFLDERLIATCTLNMCANLSWSGRPYAVIENVIVDEKERSRGYGKSVLKYAVNKAKQIGCYKVVLMTGSKQSSVLSFYQSVGFSADKTGFQIRF